MFGIQKLLKFSFFLFIILAFYSCAPSFIPEETKTALGFYSYEVGDIIEVQSNVDTNYIVLNNKNINFSFNMLGGAFEILEVIFNNKSTDKVYFEIKMTSLDSKHYLYFEEVHSQKFYTFNLLNNSTIDGVTYDSVYYFLDTITGNYAYSTKEYGFIKIKTDSMTYKFIR